MSLGPCPECGHRVASSAENCPECGNRDFIEFVRWKEKTCVHCKGAGRAKYSTAFRFVNGNPIMRDKWAQCEDCNGKGRQRYKITIDVRCGPEFPEYSKGPFPIPD